MNKSALTLKLQSLTKTKRLREVPATFKALQDVVEQQIKEEREMISNSETANENLMRSSFMSGSGGRDYVIRYIDNDGLGDVKAFLKL
jgi:hypothetical protein